jgi:hypothetical protein
MRPAGTRKKMKHLLTLLMNTVIVKEEHIIVINSK